VKYSLFQVDNSSWNIQSWTDEMPR